MGVPLLSERPFLSLCANCLFGLAANSNQSREARERATYSIRLLRQLPPNLHKGLPPRSQEPSAETIHKIIERIPAANRLPDTWERVN